MTSFPVDSFTLATLRTAEFGFFGLVWHLSVHRIRLCDVGD